MTQGALSGLTVIEYSEGLAGAMCAKAMADLGADVIKVEPPEGDASRRNGPFHDDVPNPEASGQFLYLNANKRGVSLDITASSGYETLAKLIAASDIFIAGVAAPRAKTLRLDYENVKAINPRVIATYVSHFGQTGPYAEYEGSDLIAWHMGGMGNETPHFGVTDLEKHYPLRGPAHQSEYLAGWTAATATMFALSYRETYGVGQMVDVSAMEAVANHIRGNFTTFAYDASKLPESRLKPFFPWIWPCKDGYVSTTFIMDHWWESLIDLMGRPAWAEAPELKELKGRREHADHIEPLVNSWLGQYDRRELQHMLRSKGVPCFPVLSIDEIIETPHYNERKFFVEQVHPVAGKVRQPGPPVRYWGTPWKLHRPAPALGQHNDEIQSELSAEPESNNELILSEHTESSTIFDDVPRNRPLEGIRILDLGWIISVPHCGTWLGSLGADVIRVESRARMEVSRRGLLVSADGVDGINRSAGWNNLNFSKRGITLNLTNPEAIELVKELVSISDVVTENFATDIMKRFGLDYDSLRAIKPDIIMLSGSTLGVTGPEREASGFGPNVCSYAGQPYVSGYSGGPPVNLGGNWPDYLVGTMMAFSVLSTLRHRKLTGEGQYIELSMAEVVSSLIPEAFLEYTMNGRIAERIGNHDQHMAPHNVYPCKDFDRWVAIAVRDDATWKAMCDAMGRTELAGDPRFDTLENRKRNEPELDRVVESWTRKHTSQEVTRVLQGAGVAAGPVQNVFDLIDDPHFNERDSIVNIDHPEVGTRRMLALPAKFSAMPKLAYSHSPLLGEHNAQVLGELLGNKPDRLKQLTDAEAIY